MKLLLVSEGKHEFGEEGQPGALAQLVGRFLEDVEFECRKVSDRRTKRVHRLPGIGAGFMKVALRWCREAEDLGVAALVLVVDRDGDRERQRQFDDAQHSRSSRMPRALGVAVETFDAWVLADERALTGALGRQVDRQPDPEKLRQPKRVASELLKASSVALSPSELYRKVLAAADLQQLRTRCPDGFGTFADRLERLAAELARISQQ